MCGYIKLHRKITEWEWYDDGNTFNLFVHLLLHANHKQKKWHGITIPKGSLLTGRESLSKSTGLSIQNVRTSLSKLKSTSEVTIKVTNRHSLVTIVNWDKYQIDERTLTSQSTSQLTNNQPATNQLLTTTKNVKKVKNSNSKATRFSNSDVYSENIPDTFKIFSDGLNFLSPEKEYEGFKDWWAQKAGRDALKVDWPATWRSWVRRAIERNPDLVASRLSATKEDRQYQKDKEVFNKITKEIEDGKL